MQLAGRLHVEPVTWDIAGGTWRTWRAFHCSYALFKSSQAANTTSYHSSRAPEFGKGFCTVHFSLLRDGCPARLPRQTINCTGQTTARGGRRLLLAGGELMFVTMRKPRAMLCLPKLESNRCSYQNKRWLMSMGPKIDQDGPERCRLAAKCPCRQSKRDVYR